MTTDPRRTSDLVLELCSTPGSSCRDVVLDAVPGLDGVVSCHVDPHSCWALVSFDPDRTDPATILAALDRAGFQPASHRVFDDEPAPALDREPQAPSA